MHRVGMGEELPHQGMPCLVVSDALLFALGDVKAAAFESGEHPIQGLLEVGHLDIVFLRPCGEQGRLVAQVLEVRAHESWGPAGQDGEVHVRAQALVAGVDLEDGLASVKVRPGHHDLAVKASRPKQGRVEDVRAIGGGQHDDPGVRLKTVHLRQELVQGLLTFVVSAPEARPSLPSHRIDLIDEDDARGIGLGLAEHVPHPGRTHPHEHLHEVRAGDGVEGHGGLSGDGPGKQGLPGPRRPHEEHPFGDLGPQPGEPPGRTQVLDDLPHFLDDLIYPGHILERHLRELLGHEFRPGLAKRERTTPLHLAHHVRPKHDDQGYGKEVCKERDEPGIATCGLKAVRHPLGIKFFLQVCVDRGALRGPLGGEPFPSLKAPFDVASLDHHLLHLAGGQKLLEVREGVLADATVVHGPEDLDQNQPQHNRHQCKGECAEVWRRKSCPLHSTQGSLPCRIPGHNAPWSRSSGRDTMPSR